MMESSHTEQLGGMLRSHVERALQEIWEDPELVTDGDGDYPFRSDTSLAWVSVVGGAEPAVRVTAQAAHGVPKSARLLTEINELNQRSRWAKVSWRDGAVLVDAAVHWTSVDLTSLTRAMDSVTGVADDIGLMLATVYGGSTPFPHEVDLADQGPEAA